MLNARIVSQPLKLPLFKDPTTTTTTTGEVYNNEKTWRGQTTFLFLTS